MSKTISYQLIKPDGDTVWSQMPLKLMQEIIRRAKTIEDYYDSGLVLIDKDIVIPKELLEVK